MSGSAARVAGQAIARSVNSGGTELDHARVVRGLALIMSGQADEGASVVEEAASHLAAMGSRMEAALAWRDLAEALIQRGRSEQAIDALRRAADYAGVRSSSIPANLAVPAPSGQPA